MSEWYSKISADPEDLSPLIECIAYYEAELEDARREVNIAGSLEQASAALPGIVEHRYTQLQEIEAILEFLNIRFRKVKGVAFKKYLEAYNRQLSSRDAEKYADTDNDVIQTAMLVNQFALLRNYYLSIHKALDLKGFQISNITKLRVAGLEDVTIRPIYVPRKKDYTLPTPPKDDTLTD
jgi:hypothetical protein